MLSQIKILDDQKRMGRYFTSSITVPIGTTRIGLVIERKNWEILAEKEETIQLFIEISLNGGRSWLELGGAGMIHPNVLKAGGIDPKKWQGFYINIGLDRLVMMKYGIDDIRLMHSGDLRFLRQF